MSFDEAFEKVSLFFKSRNKAIYWLHTPNPNFGNTSPFFLIASGRGNKVYLYIENALEENNSKVNVDL